MSRARPAVIVAGALSVAALGFGLVLGRAGDLSETDVINHYADRYAAETGRPRTDCLAVPGADEVWISVRCTGAGAARVFDVDRRGRLLSGGAGPST
ncbi:MAG: hypothetical protein AAGJ74_15685 [Pseudomonadota bacterium]